MTVNVKLYVLRPGICAVLCYLRF